MAHPHKKEGVDGHNAKLRKYTRHYGDADPAMTKYPPMDQLKRNGPEDDEGFGVNYDAARARSDRPGRKSVTANPLATYKKGGKVKAHAKGGEAKHRARGGRLKSPKGKGTHVNVIVSPHSGQTPGAGLGALGLAAPGATAGVPPGGPPILPPPVTPPPRPLVGGPGGPPMAPGAPGGIPPGLIPPRAKGGRVKATGHMTAGADSGPGRLQKAAWRARNAKHEHPQDV
jgi:hypothetical protein